MINDILMNFFLNKLIERTYNGREGKKVLTTKIEKKEIRMSFNEALQSFHSELKTTSAPDLSVCYMLEKGSHKVRLIAYRYGKDSTDLEGNGIVFGSIDQARAYAFHRGYIIPEPPKDQ